MINWGAGRGFSGHPDVPPIIYSGDWETTELGDAVLTALKASSLVATGAWRPVPRAAQGHD